MYTEVPYVHQAILANLSSSLLQPSQTMITFDQISFNKQQNDTIYISEDLWPSDSLSSNTV